MLASLARDAAELLWEMVATEDLGDATQQMRDNAAEIQVCAGTFTIAGPGGDAMQSRCAVTTTRSFRLSSTQFSQLALHGVRCFHRRSCGA